MAEAFEGEIKITGANEAADDMRRLGDETRGAGQEAQSAGGRWDGFGTKLTAAGAAIAAAVVSARALSEALRVTTGVLDAQVLSVDEASRRLAGLVSRLDLVRVSNLAMQSGLELSEDQFATLSVAAVTAARATGEDYVEAVERLAVAVSEASADELAKFGIALGDVTDVSKVQEEALRQLQEEYGDTALQASNVTERVRQQQVALEDASTTFVQTVRDTGALEIAFLELADAVFDTGTSVDEFSEGGGQGIQDFAIQAGAALRTVVAAFRNAQAVISQALLLIESGYERAFGSSDAADQLERQAQQLQNEIDNRGGFSDFVQDGTERSQAAADERERRRQELLRRRARARANRDRLTEGEEAGGEGGETAPDKVLEQEKALLEEEAEIARELRDLELEKLGLITDQIKERAILAETAAMEMDAARSAKAIAKAQLDLQAESVAELEAFFGRLERANQGYETLVGLTQDALDISREQNVTAVEGFRSATAEWLKGFARQSALRGGSALAMAIGNQFFNPKGAADKFIEAGKHFALAASAGGGGAALGGGGGGGAPGSGSRTVPSARGPETGVTDTGSGEGGGTTIVNLNAPVSDKNLGRYIETSGRAARRAYGRSQSARSRRR